jgi:large subunit ribosomal protein L24
MAARIKKGDSVMVLAGKDKGKTGQVLTVLNQKSRVVVQGVNMVRRHTRPSAQTTGGIIQKEASLHVSNVAHVDPKTREATRVGFRTLEGGRKVRYAIRSGEVIDS